MSGPGNVVDLFTEQARTQPDAPAVIEGTGRWRRVTTFADLDRRGAAGAGRLRQAGIREGDRVLVLVPVSADLYAVLASLFRVGAVAVLVDPSAGRARLAEAVARVAPRAMVASPRGHLLRAVVPSVRRIPVRFVTGGWAPGARRWAGGPPAPVATLSPEAPALLTLTSGSTGRPKVAVRSHGLLAAQHVALARALALAPGDIDLATLPVVVLANLASGVTTVWPDADLRRPGAYDVARVLRQIRAERPTRSVASPAFFERLLERAAPGDLASFGRFDTGGAPVAPDLLARLAAVAETAVGVYGSTEAEPIAHTGPLADADRRRVAQGAGLLAGHPVDAVRLRLVPDRPAPLGPFAAAAWERLALPPGQAGEIVVAGDHVVPGYLDGDGDAEAKVSVDGRRWHRTGDAGRLDDAGRLWLLGRCAARSRRGGAVLYPLQVEAAVREGLGLRVAFADLDGRGVLAVVGDASVEAVRRSVPWADIDQVVAVPALPLDRRHEAKIDYPALGAMLRSRLAR